MLTLDFDSLNKRVRECRTTYNEGRVKKVIGLTIDVEGIRAFVGELCSIYNDKNNVVLCEVVGFRDAAVKLFNDTSITGGPGGVVSLTI